MLVGAGFDCLIKGKREFVEFGFKGRPVGELEKADPFLCGSCRHISEGRLYFAGPDHIIPLFLLQPFFGNIDDVALIYLMFLNRRADHSSFSDTILIP